MTTNQIRTAIVGALVGLMVASAAHAVEPISSVVRVSLLTESNTERGHGSGVHIGNGYILTAAHVVEGEEKIEVKSESGSVRPVEVVWTSPSYDVAIVKAPWHGDLKVSPLACGAAVSVGDEVSTFGNPWELEFIRTWGRVAGKERKLKRWKSAVVADMTVFGGVSGAAVFNKDDAVVGVVVGMLPGTSYTVFVPIKAVCDVLQMRVN